MRASAWTGLAVAALGAATLAGCASSGSVNSGGAATTGASPTSPAGVTPTGPASTATPPGSDGSAPAVGVTVTVTGTVIQGAEPSCLILKSDRGELELLSAKTPVHSGDQVTATGHVVRVMSHCMQGQPFLVEQLTVG